MAGVLWEVRRMLNMGLSVLCSCTAGSRDCASSDTCSSKAVCHTATPDCTRTISGWLCSQAGGSAGTASLYQHRAGIPDHHCHRKGSCTTHKSCSREASWPTVCDQCKQWGWQALHAAWSSFQPVLSMKP